MSHHLHKLWLALLYARIRRIDRKQNRLSESKVAALGFAAKHRQKLEPGGDPE